MQALQFHNVAKGLQFTELPVPNPGPGQVLVKVFAAGLCHTDINIITGKDDMLFWQRPIVLGHEIAGTIEAVGPDITNWCVDARVVAVITKSLPATLTDITTSAGIGRDGGFAQYTVLEASKILPIPDNVTFGDAAIATDAGATAYHATITEAGVSAGAKVAIIGLGGLGLTAVQIAANAGAKVYGVDLDVNKYVVAAQYGAISCGKSLHTFAGIEFDTIIDFAGAGVTTTEAVTAVRPGGQVVLVGLAAKQATIPTYDFIARGVRLVGSAGSSEEEVLKVLDLIGSNKLRPMTEEIPFRDLQNGLERLKTGQVVGRLFVNPNL